VVADLPFTALGNASPPINRAAAYPHRIKVNLANKQERSKLVEAATPAIAAWEANLPSDVTAAFVSEGVLSAESTEVQWAGCHAALNEALNQPALTPAGSSARPPPCPTPRPRRARSRSRGLYCAAAWPCSAASR
jgi:hypothetical protein